MRERARGLPRGKSSGQSARERTKLKHR
jgi:hypothetical protein